MYKDEIGATFTAVGGPATEEIDGLHLVGFEASVTSPQPLTEAYLHSLDAVVPLPRSLTFDQLRPSLLAAGLPVDEAMAAVAALATPDDLATLAELIGEPIPLEYVIEFSGHTFVEPQTGAIVDVSSVVDRVSARPADEAISALVNILERYRDDPAIAATIEALNGFSTQPLPVFEYRYAQVPDSVRGDRQLGVRATRPHGSGRAHDPARAGLDGIDLRRRRSAAAAAQRRRHEGDVDMTTMMTSSPLDSDPVPSPVRGTTIVDVFKETARAHAARTALRWREQEEWRSLSWGDYERSVTSVATAFRDWGLVHGDRVGILATNRPEWHIVDIATMSAGLVSVPVYPSNAASQVCYVLAHSGARVCFVENVDQLTKVLLRRSELPALEHVVVMDDVNGLDDGFITSLDDLRASGTSSRNRRPEASMRSSRRSSRPISQPSCTPAARPARRRAR